jgi:hypothetical protein
MSGAVAGSLTSLEVSGHTSVVILPPPSTPLTSSFPPFAAALTGCKLKAADLLYSGIATHYLSSVQYPELEDALSTLPPDRSQSVSAINDLLRQMAPPAPEPQSGLLLPAADAIEFVPPPPSLPLLSLFSLSEAGLTDFQEMLRWEGFC